MSLLMRYSMNLEAGVDEAGRGCLAGPVVAAAVILPPDFYHPKLNDSKQVSAKNREILYKVITNEALAYGVAEVDPTTIDRLNILKASHHAMNEAVKLLAIEPSQLLIDGNRFTPEVTTPYHCIIGGDALYTSISAASILAKCHRDKIMKRLHLEHPQYGWDRNNGYPTAEHRRAILEHGITPHHRLSFGPCQPQLPLE